VRAYRPALEVLEGRPLLAQILFGGDELKETFDDLPSTAVTSSLTLDDPGYLNGVAVPSPAAVFHHSFDGIATINAGGDTTPTNQPPGQTAQDLRLVLGPGGGVTVGGNLIDIITPHPYLPSGATDAEVDQVSVDVRSSQVVQLAVYGSGGQETVRSASTANAFTTLVASANDMSTDAIGNPTGKPLGEISSVFVSIPVTTATDFLEIDNLRAVVLFPGITTPPVASVSGPANGVPGQPVTFSVSATDLSPSVLAAGFTYTIDWGDGSPAQTIAAAPGNGAGTTEAHVFGHAGSFTVQATATDDNGLASDLATASIAIAATAPQVVNIAVAEQSRNGLTSFAVVFNEPLTVSSATNGNLYRVLAGVNKVVKKHKAIVFTRSLPIHNVSQSASGTTVTINLIKPFQGTVEVVVQGTVTATSGASGSVNSVKTL
jgi:hypothetical protein